MPDFIVAPRRHSMLTRVKAVQYTGAALRRRSGAEGLSADQLAQLVERGERVARRH
jgi:hypothetical protein